MPSGNEFKAYQDEIIRLAETFGTPEFSPHITFGTPPEQRSLQEISRAISNAFGSYKNISIRTDHIRCSNHPYQNLVHQCVFEPTMQKVNQETERHLPGFEPKSEHHLSLLYGYVECKKLREITIDLEKKLPSVITVSGFQIMALADRVHQWETLYSQTI